MSENKKDIRLSETKFNNQGCFMKIIQYNSNRDIIVKFTDEYNGVVHTNYKNFELGNVKNPYFPSIFNVGMIGIKYPSRVNKEILKEYRVWHDMLQRCYDEKYQNEHPTYKGVVCCKEWLLYENFYEWIHEQENFDKWLNGDRWAIDKDILIKGNKIYSPETCCLVPQNVNSLFVKNKKVRGNLPIGVFKFKDGFMAQCKNPFTNRNQRIDLCQTSEQAFQKYKMFKENIIEQVAKEEYDKNNITKQCYEAMMNYKVEITD